MSFLDKFFGRKKSPKKEIKITISPDKFPPAPSLADICREEILKFSLSKTGAPNSGVFSYNGLGGGGAGSSGSGLSAGGGGRFIVSNKLPTVAYFPAKPPPHLRLPENISSIIETLVEFLIRKGADIRASPTVCFNEHGLILEINCHFLFGVVQPSLFVEFQKFADELVLILKTPIFIELFETRTFNHKDEMGFELRIRIENAVKGIFPEQALVKTRKDFTDELRNLPPEI